MLCVAIELYIFTYIEYITSSNDVSVSTSNLISILQVSKLLTLRHAIIELTVYRSQSEKDKWGAPYSPLRILYNDVLGAKTDG